MIKYLFLCLCLLSSGVFASSAEVDVRNTIEDTKAIYWLNQEKNKAIAYGNWGSFELLKDFIKTTTLKDGVRKRATNLKNADVLLLIPSNLDESLKVYFSDDFMTVKGQSYSADPALISKFRDINMSRVAKGDSFSVNMLDEKVLKTLY
jgi:hypothetical protein